MAITQKLFARFWALADIMGTMWSTSFSRKSLETNRLMATLEEWNWDLPLNADEREAKMSEMLRTHTTSTDAGWSKYNRQIVYS